MENELIIQIVIDITGALCFILLGMILYRLSMSHSLRESSKIEKQAFTDPLTGRKNRHKFLKDMDDHIKKGNKFAICFMDLDGFKHVNDTLGHDAGDVLLIELAKMLEYNLPKTAESYRLGGDEFAIIIDKVNTIEEISKILDKLKEGLKVPVLIENTKIVLEYSLGIAIYPTDAVTRTDLMTYADDAMYYIKENGKNSYYFHNEALKAQLNNKKKMETDLKEALKNNEFSVEYQPRVTIKNLDSICLEALIYWQHPVLGKLNSEFFIKQAEEMGMVTYLDEFVLRETCKKLNSLKSKGFNNVKMAINMSNMHAKRHDFVDKLCSIISEYTFDKGDLEIEFTGKIEIKNLANYKYIMDNLNSLGVKISVPSLEVRYEELKVFNELKIDEMKISSKYASSDSTFNKNILGDIVKLANDMGYLATVIAIESEAELNSAITSGADNIQGNYLFKKVNDDSLEEFLINYPSFKEGIQNIISNLNGK